MQGSMKPQHVAELLAARPTRRFVTPSRSAPWRHFSARRCRPDHRHRVAGDGQQDRPIAFAPAPRQEHLPRSARNDRADSDKFPKSGRGRHEAG